MKLKIKYVIQWFYTPHDYSGNSYTFVVVTDTRTGRSIRSSDVPESNARLIAFYLNGQQHEQNFIFTKTEMKKRQMKYYNVEYLSSCAESLAKAFQTEIRRRKSKAA